MRSRAWFPCHAMIYAIRVNYYGRACLFTAKTHKDKPEGTKTREDATKKHKDTENARYLAYNNFQ